MLDQDLSTVEQFLPDLKVCFFFFLSACTLQYYAIPWHHEIDLYHIMVDISFYHSYHLEYLHNIRVTLHEHTIYYTAREEEI